MSLSRVTQIVMLVFLVTGCAAQSVLPDFSISISKSNCLGSCPAYSMELYRDGRYVWNGRAHVSAIGTRNGGRTSDAYRQAMHLVAAADFESFKDNYETGPDCSTWTTDQQTVVVSVRNGSTGKTVRHYLGCEGFPRQDDLLHLENELEKVMHINDFVR